MMEFINEFIEDVKIAFQGVINPEYELFDKSVYLSLLMLYLTLAAGVGLIGGYFLWYGAGVIVDLFR